MVRRWQERYQRIKPGALNDTHCKMKAKAVFDALADTLAQIEAKNILRYIGRCTDKGTFRHHAPKPTKVKDKTPGDTLLAADNEASSDTLGDSLEEFKAKKVG